MTEFKIKLKLTGPPGCRKSTFLRQLNKWISSQSNLKYRTIGKHEIQVIFKEK